MSADTNTADAVATLDSSVRNGDEFETNKTVVGGLYAIADELARIAKVLEGFSNRRQFGGGAG